MARNINSINGVQYEEMSDYSLIRDRRLMPFSPSVPVDVVRVPQKTPDSNDTTHFELNSGMSEFIDGWTSYLKFNMTMITAAFKGVYIESLLNLIKTITIIDKNGLEIERIVDVNKLNSLILEEIFGSEYYTGTGSFQAKTTSASYLISDLIPGIHTRTNISTNAVPADTIVNIPNTVDFERKLIENDKLYPVVIPLSFLSSIFRTDKLLPPQLIDGLRIQIDWELASRVFVPDIYPQHPVIRDAGTTYEEASGTAGEEKYTTISYTDENLSTFAEDTKYTLSNITMVLDVYNLDMGVVSALNSEYESKGILMPILSYRKSIDVDNIDPYQSSRLALPVTQSYNKALKLICSSWLELQDTESEGLYKSLAQLLPRFVRQPLKFDKYYAIYNSRSYPYQAIETGEESYWCWCNAFNKAKLVQENRRDRKDYFDNMGSSIAIDLNRSVPNIKDSGLPNTIFYPYSAQRVDGTNPLTLHISFPELTFEEISNGCIPEEDAVRNLIVFPIVHRRVQGWMEHIRSIHLKPLNNEIYI